MLLNTVQVLTSAFLVFAGTYFIYCALKNNLTMQELADKIADITKHNRKQTFFRILGGFTQ